MKNSPFCIDPTDEVVSKYFTQVSKFMRHRKLNEAQVVKFCYTPMHGVGAPFAKKVFETFHLSPFTEVLEQINPDPDFPTVKFPNPEEIGALNFAIKTADAENCNIIFANDPDADRLAVAEKQADGTWKQFNGNEIGTILASFIIENLKIDNNGTNTAY